MLQTETWSSPAQSAWELHSQRPVVVLQDFPRSDSSQLPAWQASLHVPRSHLPEASSQTTSVPAAPNLGHVAGAVPAGLQVVPPIAGTAQRPMPRAKTQIRPPVQPASFAHSVIQPLLFGMQSALISHVVAG